MVFTATSAVFSLSLQLVHSIFCDMTYYTLTETKEKQPDESTFLLYNKNKHCLTIMPIFTRSSFYHFVFVLVCFSPISTDKKEILIPITLQGINKSIIQFMQASFRRKANSTTCGFLLVHVLRIHFHYMLVSEID